jgi:hypothetical protein
MLIRIGALSEQTGVSEELLRAWERRYGLLNPQRTAGGFRLYGDDDLARVQRMVELLGRGLSASDAARSVLSGVALAAPLPGGLPLDDLKGRLHSAFRGFDEAELEAALDAVFSTLDLDAAALELLVPALRELGEDWATGAVSVAQEHFAVNVVRARLMAMARGWDQGFGPRVVLACPEDEQHDVSLIIFGLLMRRRGWRVTFLGANTPLADVLVTQDRMGADFTVLFAAAWEEHEAFAAEMVARAARPFALAGATALPVAERTGCRALTGDPVAAANELTAEFAAAAMGRR